MSSDIIQMPKRFDYTSSTTFNKAILDAIENSSLITLDCTSLEYLDSAGIGLLVMAKKSAQQKNVKIVITNLKATPKDILLLANLQKIIEIR